MRSLSRPPLTPSQALICASRGDFCLPVGIYTVGNLSPSPALQHGQESPGDPTDPDAICRGVSQLPAAIIAFPAGFWGRGKLAQATPSASSYVKSMRLGERVV